MNPELDALLNHLHAEGVKHDVRLADRTQRYRNLDPETAHFIAMQIQFMDSGSAVVVDTSNGYGTIWLADAVAATGGRLITVDTESQEVVRANIKSAGLASVVEFVRADAGVYLTDLDDGRVDVLFLDA